MVQEITPGRDLEENLKSQLETRIAGNADEEEIVVTGRIPVQLEERMRFFQTPVSDDTIREWRKQQGMRLR